MDGIIIIVGFIVLLVVTFTAGQRLPIRVNGTRFYIGDERFFLSGANTAWVSYGSDFGDQQYNRSRPEFLRLLTNVSQAGGNSMRTWVHVDGRTSPAFGPDGSVVGLDRNGTFLAEFRRYLDDARARNVLVFATLWNGALLGLGYWHELVTNTTKLQSYVDHALRPWVRIVKDHPAMGGWDVINEMEGVVIPGQENPDTCFDTRFLTFSTAGFAGKAFHMQELLRFINWQAEAILTEDPEALVTAGSWRQWSQSSAFGGRNVYSDECLVKAGGRPKGTLTFYSTHIYSMLKFMFWPDAAFKHKMAEYRLDKPVVLAEFSQTSGAGMTITDQFLWAYKQGYSGAWSWQAVATGSGSDSFPTQLRGIGALKSCNNQTEGGRVPIHINTSTSTHPQHIHIDYPGSDGKGKLSYQSSSHAAGFKQLARTFSGVKFLQDENNLQPKIRENVASVVTIKITNSN